MTTTPTTASRISTSTIPSVSSTTTTIPTITTTTISTSTTTTTPTSTTTTSHTSTTTISHTSTTTTSPTCTTTAPTSTTITSPTSTTTPTTITTSPTNTTSTPTSTFTKITTVNPSLLPGAAIHTACGYNRWNITIEMKLMRLLYPNIQQSDIYLGDPGCKGTIEFDMILVFQQDLHNCSTTETVCAATTQNEPSDMCTQR